MGLKVALAARLSPFLSRQLYVVPLFCLYTAATEIYTLSLHVALPILESKVPSELEQLLVEQTSKVTLPVSWLSPSRNVAVRVGVAVFRRAASAGLSREGVSSVAQAVCVVVSRPLAVAAALPVARAVSRTI